MIDEKATNYVNISIHKKEYDETNYYNTNKMEHKIFSVIGFNNVICKSFQLIIIGGVKKLHAVNSRL